MVLLLRINPTHSWPGVLCANAMDPHKPHFVPFSGGVSRPHSPNSTSCQGCSLGPVEPRCLCEEAAAGTAGQGWPCQRWLDISSHLQAITAAGSHHIPSNIPAAFRLLSSAAEIGKGSRQDWVCAVPRAAFSPQALPPERQFPARPPLPQPNAPQFLPASDNPDEFSEIAHIKQKTSQEGFVSEVIY